MKYKKCKIIKIPGIVKQYDIKDACDKAKGKKGLPVGGVLYTGDTGVDTPVMEAVPSIDRPDPLGDLVFNIGEVLSNLDDELYTEKINDRTYRIYFGNKSIMNLEYYASKFDDYIEESQVVVIEDYAGHSQMYNLLATDEIVNYVIRTVSSIIF